MMKSNPAIAALIVALTFGGPAIGQPADVQRGIDQLLPRIRPELQQEGALPKAPEQKPPAAQPGRWAEVKRGMDEDEIEALLGKPDRVEVVARGKRWYWEQISPKGWIDFGAESGEVTSWQRYF